MSDVRARSVSDAGERIKTEKKGSPTEESGPSSAVDNAIDTEPLSLKKYGALENLTEKILHRPSKGELVYRNILKDDKSSPSLQAKQQELKKRKLEDSLNHKIGKRSSVVELIHQNILMDPNVASSLHLTQKNLKRSMCEAELNRHLRERQPIEELVKKQIIKDTTSV
ncbi:hypothetical protein HMI54_003057 [Coelomomyces lativittatus]|nr:hypothetical protein HMI54_003057 [Coelomomyces lativittatus]KAJ1517213.1 hypothetical protein HMI55_000363 [Coelomomyces lativittatus]